jgi:hypothetical protein
LFRSFFLLGYLDGLCQFITNPIDLVIYQDKKLNEISQACIFQLANNLALKLTEQIS